MNWKPNLSRCLVMAFGLTLVGCGSTADTTSEPQATSSPATTNSPDITLVTLDLPGMT